MSRAEACRLSRRAPRRDDPLKTAGLIFVASPGRILKGMRGDLKDQRLNLMAWPFGKVVKVGSPLPLPVLYLGEGAGPWSLLNIVITVNAAVLLCTTEGQDTGQAPIFLELNK